MLLSEFAFKSNRQRPQQCFEYVKHEGKNKYSIFTMNAGNSYLASHEAKRADGKYYTEKADRFTTLSACLIFLTQKTK